MKLYQTLLAIRDAMAADDLGAAEAALEKHCNDYLEWAVDNYSVAHEGFNLCFLKNSPTIIFVNAEEVLLKDFYQMYLKHENFKR